MIRKKANYFILCLLSMLFLAPGVAAYFFYNHPSLLGTSKVNKGYLIPKPFQLSHFEPKQKWHLMLWSPNACKKTCIEQLNTLSKVRLALGRRYYEVDLWLLKNEADSVEHQIKHYLQQNHIYNFSWSGTDEKSLTILAPKNNIFLVNPQGYVILAYKKPVNPNAIYKDLKLLLNSTQTKNG